MSELSDKAQAIVDRDRNADDPTPEDRARVHKALVATLAAGSAAGAATAAAANAAAAGGVALKTGLVTKTLLVVSMLGAATTLVVLRSEPEPDTNSVPRSLATPLPEPALEPIEPEALPLVEEETPPPTKEKTLRSKKQAPVPTTSEATAPAKTETPAPLPEPVQLAQELELLESAQVARRKGDVERALQILQLHQERFPDGSLATERAATRAMLLCESGKVAEGLRAAKQFEKRYPKSMLLRKVRKACIE